MITVDRHVTSLLINLRIHSIERKQERMESVTKCVMKPQVQRGTP